MLAAPAVRRRRHAVRDRRRVWATWAPTTSARRWPITRRSGPTRRACAVATPTPRVGPSGEQAGVRAAADERRCWPCATATPRTRQRFGHVFVVCATGKSAPEMLALAARAPRQRARGRARVAARRAGGDHPPSAGEAGRHESTARARSPPTCSTPRPDDRRVASRSDSSWRATPARPKSSRGGSPTTTAACTGSSGPVACRPALPPGVRDRAPTSPPPGAPGSTPRSRCVSRSSPRRAPPRAPAPVARSATRRIAGADGHPRRRRRSARRPGVGGDPPRSRSGGLDLGAHRVLGRAPP